MRETSMTIGRLMLRIAILMSAKLYESASVLGWHYACKLFDADSKCSRGITKMCWEFQSALPNKDCKVSE